MRVTLACVGRLRAGPELALVPESCAAEIAQSLQQWLCQQLTLQWRALAL